MEVVYIESPLQRMSALISQTKRSQTQRIVFVGFLTRKRKCMHSPGYLACILCAFAQSDPYRINWLPAKTRIRPVNVKVT